HAVSQPGDTRPEPRPETRPDIRADTGHEKKDTGPDKPRETGPDKPKDPNPPDKPKDPNPPEHPPIGDPNDVAQVVLVKDVPNFLVRRTADKPGWQLISPQAKVTAGTSLVALPGFRGQLHANSGVDMLLFANVPQFLNIPLFETAVSLRPRDADVDL